MNLLSLGASKTEQAVHERLTWRDWWPIMVAALLAAGAVVILLLGMASVSPSERPVALASLTRSVYWIAAAVIGACGTIAGLMLTTVSLLEHLETRKMRPPVLFYLRLTIQGAMAAIACAVAALLLTTFPVASGVDVAPPRWQIDGVFFGLLALTVLLSGAFAVVLTSLSATVAEIFRTLPEEVVEEILADEPAPPVDRTSHHPTGGSQSQ